MSDDLDGKALYKDIGKRHTVAISSNLHTTLPPSASSNPIIIDDEDEEHKLEVSPTLDHAHNRKTKPDQQDDPSSSSREDAKRLKSEMPSGTPANMIPTDEEIARIVTEMVGSDRIVITDQLLEYLTSSITADLQPTPRELQPVINRFVNESMTMDEANRMRLTTKDIAAVITLQGRASSGRGGPACHIFLDWSNIGSNFSKYPSRFRLLDL